MSISSWSLKNIPSHGSRSSLQLSVGAMLSKRGLPFDADELPPSRRFRSNLGDLFLSNEISAARAQSIFADAVAAGTAHVADLARVGGRSVGRRNTHRDLLRKLLKGTKWPPPYWASLRVWNPTTQLEEQTWCPMLLPHELTRAIASRTAHRDLLCEKGNM